MYVTWVIIHTHTGTEDAYFIPQNLFGTALPTYERFCALLAESNDNESDYTLSESDAAFLEQWRSLTVRCKIRHLNHFFNAMNLFEDILQHLGLQPLSNTIIEKSSHTVVSYDWY